MLPREERDVALDLAVAAIVHRLRTGRSWLPARADLPPGLQADGAAFVTLRRHGDLLGCIGTLAPHEALGVTIARYAAAAAFEDPRMPAVTRDDLPEMDVHISVLGPLEPLEVSGWDALAAALRPGVDGLLVEDDGNRATFLPAVWESLPDPQDFLVALWRKAWLPPRHWTARTRISRYGAEEFGGYARDHGPLATAG